MNEISYKIPTMLTINETASTTRLSKNFIRNLCSQNKIVHVRAGNKVLVNLEKLIEYLNELHYEPEEQFEMVRKLY